VAGWTSAEEIVMGTMRFDPGIYQAVLAAMAPVLERLRADVDTLDALIAAGHDPGVVALASAAPSPVAPETVVAAASAIRYRELAYQIQLGGRRAAIQQARERGEAWARTEEPPFGAAPRTELLVHVDAGLGVTSSTEFHLDRGSILYIARPVRVDLESGAITGAADELGEERVAENREELAEIVAEFVAAIERLA
jgi:hypothetical protein